MLASFILSICASSAVFAIARLAFNPPTVHRGHSFKTSAALLAPAPADVTLDFKSSDASVVPIPVAVVIKAGRTQGYVESTTKAATVSGYRGIRQWS